MRAARREPRRGEIPMTAFQPWPVFVCCLWAHSASAPGSSVEQEQMNETKDKHFPGRKCFMVFMIETTVAACLCD